MVRYAGEQIFEQANNINNLNVFGSILYNVKAYGARGDGVTDDTASIQATIDYAVSVGGKSIFFPHGTYNSASLTNTSSVVFVGDGAQFSGNSYMITQFGAAPLSNLERQAVINGNFDVWQRGMSFTNPTSGQYNADRFSSIFSTTGTLPTILTHSKLTLTSGEVPNSFYGYRVNTNGPGSGFGTNDSYSLLQRIENGTRYLCGLGKKVTVSFWAKSDIAGKKIGIRLSQTYGSGGSPSEVINGQNWTLTSTWTKYSFTFTTNTLTGKTWGINDDDYLTVLFYYMWGATAASQVGASVAESFVGSGNIDIAQVQVNTGDQALPFQPRSFAEELQLCKRYCHVITDNVNANFLIGFGTAAITITAFIGLSFPVQMRVIPTLVATAADWSLFDGAAAGIALTAITLQSSSKSNTGATINATVAAGLTQFRPYSLNANAINKLFILDAEI